MAVSAEDTRVASTLTPEDVEKLDFIRDKYYRAPTNSHAIRLAIVDIYEIAKQKELGTDIL